MVHFYPCIGCQSMPIRSDLHCRGISGLMQDWQVDMDWLGLGSPPEWLSMQCQSANAAPIQCQSKPSPIRQFQSQSETNRSQSLQRIRQYYANRGPFRQDVFNQSNANPVPIQCQLKTNPVPILCQSNANSLPIENQSSVNPVPILCHSEVNSVPI